MTKIIRVGSFETNSSSSHSISFDNRSEYQSITPDENGEIHLGVGEYGWEFEDYDSAFWKADYCALDSPNDDMLIKAIKEHTGAKAVILHKTGYIDHQSHGTTHKIFESELKLKDFIFKNGILHTGNDNC